MPNIPPPPWESDTAAPPPAPWESNPTQPGTGGKAGIPAPRTEFQKKAAKNLANLQHERATAEYQQDMVNVRNKAIATGAEMAVVAGAAPIAAAAVAGSALTGAAATALGFGTAAAAGLTGGLTREGILAFGGSTDTNLVKSANPEKALAISLGVDAGTNLFGEAVGQGLGYFGKHLLPKLLIHASGKTAAGMRVLNSEIQSTRAALTGEISDVIAKAEAQELEMAAEIPIKKAVGSALTKRTPPPTGNFQNLIAGETGAPFRTTSYSSSARSVRGTGMTDLLDAPLHRAEQAFQKISGKASGPWASEYTGLTPEAEKELGKMIGQLRMSHGGTSTQQPLELMVQLQHDVAGKAWDMKNGFSPKERLIMQDLAEDLHRGLKKDLQGISPKAVALLERSKSLYETTQKRSIAVALAERSLGGMVGSAIGYRKGGVKGAIAGAAAGTISSEAAFRAAPWLLQKVWATPASREAANRAIGFMLKGSEGRAQDLFARAIALSGTRELAKEYMKDPASFLGNSVPQPGAPPGQ